MATLNPDNLPPIKRDSLGRIAPNTGAVIRGRSRKDPILKLIDKHCGENAERVIEFLTQVALGTVATKERAPHKNEDALAYALVPETVPTIAERIGAARVIVNYRHGPARDVAPDDTELRPGFVQGPYDLSLIDEKDLADLESTLQKAMAKSWSDRGVVNVEPVNK